MRKTHDYSQITTLEELDSAIGELHRSNGIAEKELRECYAILPEIYTPQAVAREAVRRAAHSINFYGFALGAIQFAKRLLKK